MVSPLSSFTWKVFPIQSHFTGSMRLAIGSTSGRSDGTWKWQKDGLPEISQCVQIDVVHINVNVSINTQITHTWHTMCSMCSIFWIWIFWNILLNHLNIWRITFIWVVDINSNKEFFITHTHDHSWKDWKVLLAWVGIEPMALGFVILCSTDWAIRATWCWPKGSNFKGSQ